MQTQLIIQQNECPSVKNFGEAQTPCNAQPEPKPFSKEGKGKDISQQVTRENSMLQDEDSSQYSEEESRIQDDDHFFVEKTSNDGEDNHCRFESKTHDQMRLSYINKLVNMKVMNLKPKKKSQNIFVFDWDDTLFCTTSLGNAPLNKIPSKCQTLLNKLDNSASSLLAKAANAGETFIITNSDKGWVEQSAKFVLPKTLREITRKNIQVISARNLYSELYPNDMYRWKMEAFLSLKSKFEGDVMTNLVVIGDADIEMQAANALGKEFTHSIVKTVKLKECPKVDELLKQQQLVINLFDEIFMSCKAMTIKLGKSSSA